MSEKSTGATQPIRVSLQNPLGEYSSGGAYVRTLSTLVYKLYETWFTTFRLRYKIDLQRSHRLSMISD